MKYYNKHPFILYKYFTKELLLFFLFALFSLTILVFFIDLIELFLITNIDYFIYLINNNYKVLYLVNTIFTVGSLRIFLVTFKWILIGKTKTQIYFGLLGKNFFKT